MPETIVSAPDGSRITVRHPEGASPEQIIAYAKQNWRPKAQKTEGPSMAQRGKDLLASMGTAAGSGIANIVGLPGTIGQALAREEDTLIPSPMNVLAKLPSGEQIKSAMFEGLGVPRYEPKSGIGKIGQATIEGAVSGALMPFGGIGQAMKFGGLAGAASEGAGQVYEGTSLETPARIVGALAGPIALDALGRNVANVAKGALGKRPIQGDLDKMIVSTLQEGGKTPEQMRSIMAKAQSTGATMANRNLPLTSETVKAAQETPEAAILAREAAKRDIIGAYGRIRRDISSAAPFIDDTATGIQGGMLRDMRAKAEPLYQKYEQTVAQKGFTESAPRAAIARLYQSNPDVLQRVLRNAQRAEKPITGIRLTETGALDTRGATVGDLGKIIEGIDEVIYGADDFAKSFQTSTGKPNAQARALLDIRSKLDEFRRSKSPELAKANDIFSTGHKMRRAVDEGYEALSETRGLGDAKAFFDAATKGERDAFVGGLTSRLVNNLDTMALTPSQIEKTYQKISPFMSKSVAGKIRSILENEAVTIETARSMQSVMPSASGFGFSGPSRMARLAGGVASSPKGTLVQALESGADRFLTGRGPEYYNQLNIALVKAATSNNPKEAVSLLNGIIKRQKEMATTTMQRRAIAAATSVRQGEGGAQQ